MTIPNNLHNLAEMPTVLSDGTVIESFVDAGYFAEGSTREGDFAARRAWVVRSIDGGYTFSIPLFVNDACGPPPGFRLSALAVDTSAGPFHNRLYFGCRALGRGPIVVNTSSDRGEHWSMPRALPLLTSAAVPEERIPALAVNHHGVVVAAWIDGRTGTDHLCQQSVFVAASVDGGTSWFGPTQVSSVPVCPAATRVASSTGGDYFGLVAAADGTFRILWSEMRNGVSELTIAAITVEAH